MWGRGGGQVKAYSKEGYSWGKGGGWDKAYSKERLRYELENGTRHYSWHGLGLCISCTNTWPAQVEISNYHIAFSARGIFLEGFVMKWNSHVSYGIC